MPAMSFIVAAAILPVIILVAFILRKDSNSPEPPCQLLKAFSAGCLCVIPALALACLFTEAGLVPAEVTSVWKAVLNSFWGAAIPEEIAKLLMLWLVLHKNPYFDEKMDGIVYAVCVSLGFAAIENVFYLISNADSFLRVGIMRALFAIPGHFCDGVLMGYYYSLAVFAARSRTRHRLLILGAPVLAHGVYDSLLFSASVSGVMGGILFLIFPVFCYQLWKYASRRIARHLAADGVIVR